MAKHQGDHPKKGERWTKTNPVLRLDDGSVWNGYFDDSPPGYIHVRVAVQGERDVKATFNFFWLGDRFTESFDFKTARRRWQPILRFARNVVAIAQKRSSKK